MPVRRLTAIVAALALAVGALVATPIQANASGLDAPTGLKERAIDGTSTAFQLSWAPVAGAVAYSVNISLTNPAVPTGDTTNGTLTLLTYTNSVTPTSFLATNAGLAETVSWKVAAYGTSVSSANLGTPSAVSSFTRAAIAAPAALSPVGTTATPANLYYPNAMALTWGAVPGAQSYTVTYATTSDFSSGVKPPVTIVGTSYAPTSLLTRGTKWYWKVAANIVAYKFDGTATGIAPISTASSVAQAFIVTWDDPTVVGDGSQPQILTQHDVATTTNPVLTDPLLSWSAVTGAASYLLEMGTAKSGGVISPITTTTTVYGTTYIPPVLLANQGFFWQVTAVDTTGNYGTTSTISEFQKVWGAQDESTAAALAGTAAPQPPLTGAGSLSASTPEAIPINRLKLSWAPLARASYYNVSVYSITTVAGQLVIPNTASYTCKTETTTATIIISTTGASSGQNDCLLGIGVSSTVEYKWVVQAVQVDAAGAVAVTSVPSAARYFTLVVPDSGTALDPFTGKPTHISTDWATQISAGSPYFAWNPVLGANIYKVDVAVDAGFSNIVQSFVTTETILQPTGVFADTTTTSAYYWRVQAGTGNGAFTNQMSAVSTPDDSGWQWKKTSTKSSFVGTTLPVTQSNGTVVLRWTPQSKSAPNDGGNRGYLVKIYAGDSAIENSSNLPINGAGGKKTSFPFIVAATAAGVPLTENGHYAFTVAPLDANGTAGNVSDPVTFTVATSQPTLGTKVVDAGNSSVRLSWTPTSGAKNYTVKVTSPSGVTSLTGAGGGTTTITTEQTSVSVPGISGSSVDYTWSVAPTKPGTIIGTTAVGAFTVPLPAVQLMTTDNSELAANSSPATLAPTGRVLTWAPVVGATKYLVAITPANSSVVTDYTVATNYVIPSSVAYGSLYSWTVTALAGDTASPTVSRIANTPVARSFATRTVPAQVSQAKPAVTATGLTVNWTTLSTSVLRGGTADVKYIVQRRVKPAIASEDWSGANTFTTLAGASSYTVTGIALNTNYEFRVAAVNTDLEQGPWSVNQDNTTATYPTAAPTTFRATSTLGGLSLSWIGVPVNFNGGLPVTSYSVAYKRTTDSTWSGMSTPNSALTLTGLDPLTSYDVQVAAVNAIGAGPGAALSATTFALPSAPSILVAVRGNAQVTLNWTASTVDGGSAITGYTLERRYYDKVAKVWTAWSAWTVAPSTSYVVTSLANGTAYEFRIMTRTALGTSVYAYSPGVTPAGKPFAPATLTLTAKKGKFVLKWPAAANNGTAVKNYVVQYSTNAKKWSTVSTLSASKRTLTTTKGKKGKVAYFRVVAKNAVGTGTYSYAVSAIKK